MATAKICDRCRKILHYASDCKIKIYIHPYGDYYYNLCNDCTQILRKWLSERGSENGT